MVMGIERIAATYSIIGGITMIIFWMMLYHKKELSEITMEPVKAFIHIGSDIGTAIILIIGGFGILADQVWGFSIYFVSMGLLMYSIMNFLGYYGQEKNWPVVGFYILLFVVAFAFTLAMLLEV